MIKSWYKYFVYLSLLFLAVALYNADYLKIPQLFSLPILVLSFIFLFAGFINSAISWKQILNKSRYSIRLGECIAGTGLSIFGKYIPGKIWMVMGRAAYITKKNQLPLGILSAISLKAQLIALWTGLIFGMVGLFLLDGLHLWAWLILCLWVCFTVVIFSQFIHAKGEHLLRILFKKDIKVPKLTFKSIISLTPWFFLNWALWSIGFYALVASITANDVPWSVGLGFPLAATLGIMSLITPGGIGAREGLIVGYLGLAGLSIADAATIAVASRLWFLLGELFIFIAGWIAHKRSNGALY
jgi:glycosyltransferase 2 family protein